MKIKGYSYDPDLGSRTSYIKAKIGVLVPSQIKALRLKSNMRSQADLAKEAGMHRSRISMLETPGCANMTLETLSRLAAAFRVGLVVKFVPLSEMLDWENRYSQDTFDKVTKVNALILEARLEEAELISEARFERAGRESAFVEWLKQRIATLAKQIAESPK